MPLINYEINLILTWSANFFIIDAPVNNQATIFGITDTKLYVLVVIYQLKIMQNYCNNCNQVLKEELSGININQK